MQERISLLSHTGRCLVTAVVPVRNGCCEAIPRGFGAGGPAGSALLSFIPDSLS